MSQYPKCDKTAGAKFWDSNPCGGNWNTYREFMDWIQKTEPYFFEILNQYDWTGKKVIEIGCGQGTTLNYLPLRNAEMIGLDMSFLSIEMARAGAEELNQGQKVQLLQADAEQLPFVSGIFDVAISCGVLHHTSDTVGGIKNIYRILKPGGIAIIMLYHSGNPKWWATRLLRGISKMVDSFFNRPGFLLEKLRSSQKANSTRGTALLELFGVPILKAFRYREVLSMFSVFSEVKITNHQPGFKRLVDIIPILVPITNILTWIDQKTVSIWGFYQVIQAKK